MVTTLKNHPKLLYQIKVNNIKSATEAEAGIKKRGSEEPRFL